MELKIWQEEPDNRQYTQNISLCSEPAGCAGSTPREQAEQGEGEPQCWAGTVGRNEVEVGSD